MATVGVAADFIATLYPDCESGWMGLFDISTSETAWAKVGDDVAPEGMCDVYFNVGLQGGEKPGRHQRGKAAGVCAIPGVWIDIDFEKPDQKKSYPPKRVVYDALQQMPFASSMIVHSGGGLHVYWLFTEPLAITDENRAAAKAMIAGWQELFRQKLQRFGSFTVDSTHDLARMLRIPGTTNSRADRLVTVEPLDAVPRYDFDAIADVVPQIETSEEGRGKKPCAYDENMDAPSDKFGALLANSPHFRRVWERKYKTEWSASEHDLSLARQAAQAAWTEAEITSLIVAWRRKHGELGSLRPDKVRRVLDIVAEERAKAESWYHLSEATNAVEAAVIEAQAPASEGTESEVENKRREVALKTAREAAMVKIRTILGVPIKRWLQFGRQKAEFFIELESGEQVHLGRSKEWSANLSTFTACLIESVQVAPDIKRGKWQDLRRALCAVVEVIEGEEYETAKVIDGHIADYVQRLDVYSGDQKFIALKDNANYVANGRLYVKLDHWHSWALRKKRDVPSIRLCYSICTQNGWERRTETAHSPGRTEQVGRSYWSKPVNDLPVELQMHINSKSSS